MKWMLVAMVVRKKLCGTIFKLLVYHRILAIRTLEYKEHVHLLTVTMVFDSLYLEFTAIGTTASLYYADSVYTVGPDEESIMQELYANGTRSTVYHCANPVASGHRKWKGVKARRLITKVIFH